MYNQYHYGVLEVINAALGTLHVTATLRGREAPHLEVGIGKMAYNKQLYVWHNFHSL
jgi:hypothetical protein